MADDNDIKSRYRKKLEDINTLPSRVTERIYDIYTEASTKTKSQLDLEARLDRITDARERASKSVELARKTGDDQLDAYRRQHQRLAEREAKTREQIESEEINRRENARRMSSRYVGVSLSSERLERETGRLGASVEARFLGRDIARQMSQTEIQQLSRYNLEHQQQTTAEIISLSKDVDNPNSAARMQGLIRKLGRQQVFGGTMSAALGVQREMGLDEISTQRRAAGISERISKELEIEGIRAKVASGDVRSYKEEMNTYKELRDAVKKTAEEILSLGEAGSELRKKQEDQIAAYEKQKQIVKEMQEGGGGGGLTTAQKIGLAGRGISAISGVSYNLAVGSEIEQTRVRTGIASVMNQQFFNQQRAMSGDMSSLLISSAGIDASMLERAETMRTRARRYGAGSAIGDFGQSAGAAMGAAAARDIPGAINSAVSGVENAAKSGIGFAKGIPQSATAVETYGVGMGLSEEMIRIRAQSLQAFYNDRMAAYQAATGTGAISSTLMDEMTNPALASRLGNIDLNRQKNLFNLGATQVGISFSQSAENRERILSSAALTERRGLMSAEQYMSNLGKITAAGGSQKDLEDALANAVSRGVNDAASIGRMVDAMTNLSQMADQGRGVSGTSAALQAFGLGLESFKGTTFDQRQREQNVMAGLANFQQMTSGVDMSINTVSQIAELKKRFPGIGGATLQNAVSLGTQGAADLLDSLRKYENAKPEDKQTTKRKIEELGLSGMFFDPKTGELRSDYLETGKSLYKSELLSVADVVGLRGGNKAREEYLEVIEGKKNFSEISAQTKDTMASLKINRATTEALEGVLTGTKASGGIYGQQGAGVTREQAATAIDMSTQASIKNINAFGNSMEEVVKRMQYVLDNFSPEKSFSKTQEAVEKMDLDISGFSNSVKRFEDAVEAFAQTQGLSRVGSTPQPESWWESYKGTWDLTNFPKWPSK